MQGNWKHKVQQQEATPPEGVWDTLALALNETDKTPHWQTRIYHTTETPPTGTWEQVALALDQIQPIERLGWQERIYQYEAMPPADSWQHITATLYLKETNTDWPALIYGHEALPPQGLWQAIAAQIDADETPVVPIARKPLHKTGIFRLTAAAITVLAVAGTAIWLMRDGFSNQTTQAIAATIGTPTTQQKVKTITTSENRTTNVSTPAKPTAVLSPAIATKVASAKTQPTNNNQPIEIAPLEYVSNTETASLSTEAVLQNTNKLLNDKGEANIDINSLGAPNSNYISISGPDGQSIRVSAKFANLLGYLSGTLDKEERLDRIIKESAYWKATFKQWREKMAEITATPSLSNFMDVVELAKILQ